MKRTIARTLIVLALIGGAWAVGGAQSNIADFEITVDAPGGTVVMTCHRGCEWMNYEDNVKDLFTGQSIPDTAGPNKFVFGCRPADRCRGSVNGRGFMRR